MLLKGLIDVEKVKLQDGTTTERVHESSILKLSSICEQDISTKNILFKKVPSYLDPRPQDVFFLCFRNKQKSFVHNQICVLFCFFMVLKCHKLSDNYYYYYKVPSRVTLKYRKVYLQFQQNASFFKWKNFNYVYNCTIFYRFYKQKLIQLNFKASLNLKCF